MEMLVSCNLLLLVCCLSYNVIRMNFAEKQIIRYFCIATTLALLSCGTGSTVLTGSYTWQRLAYTWQRFGGKMKDSTQLSYTWHEFGGKLSTRGIDLAGERR